jgi:hypothetical protein
MTEPWRACLISGVRRSVPFRATPRRDPAAGHSLSSQAGKPAGRAIGSQPSGSLDATGKTPQFLRDTQSEPYRRRGVSRSVVTMRLRELQVTWAGPMGQ